jgi:multiple sugar transport system substrate-binding protein
MKKCFIFSVCVLLTFTVIGCSGKKESGSGAATGGSATTASGTASGPETIEMWGWNAGQIEQLFAEYKRQTGANVNLNYSAVAQQEVFQKLQTVVSAGLDMPDVVPSEAGQRGTMIALDIWEDLLKPPYNFNINTFFPYLQPLVTNERRELVALPWDVTSAALAYKRDLAQQYLGVSNPVELQTLLPTWDAFIEAGRLLQAGTDGKIFMFCSLGNIYQIGSGQNPQPIVANEKLDMTPVVSTLQLVERFRDNRVADTIMIDTPAYNASYVDNTHIFYPCASWSPEYQIGPNDPQGPTHQWGLMVPPEGCFSWGGTANMIPKAAKHKLEAFKFISWLISKEGTLYEHNVMTMNMSNVEAFQDPSIASMGNKYFGDQNLGEILFGAIDTIKVRPVSRYDVVLQDTYNLVIEQMNSDRSVTSAKAAQIFETELRNKAPDIE